MDQMIAALDRSGFCVIPGVLSPAKTQELIEAVSKGGKHFGLRNLLGTSAPVSALAGELVSLVAPFMAAKPFPVRGLFFDKLAGANWEVGWHQDLSIAVAERIDTPGFAGWSVKKGVMHTQPPASVLE